MPARPCSRSAASPRRRCATTPRRCSMASSRTTLRSCAARSRRARATGRPGTSSSATATPAKGLVWMRARCTPLVGQDGSLQWHGFINDITQRRENDEQLRKLAFLVNNSRDFIGMSDLAGRPLYVNQAGLALVGLDDMAALRNLSLEDFFFPEDRAADRRGVPAGRPARRPRHDRDQVQAFRDRRADLDELQRLHAQVRGATGRSALRRSARTSTAASRTTTGWSS